MTREERIEEIIGNACAGRMSIREAVDAAAEIAISDIHNVALANVSGALVDSGVVVPDDETRYGEAVREIARERDEARRMWNDEANLNLRLKSALREIRANCRKVIDERYIRIIDAVLGAPAQPAATKHARSCDRCGDASDAPYVVRGDGVALCRSCAAPPSPAAREADVVVEVSTKEAIAALRVAAADIKRLQAMVITEEESDYLCAKLDPAYVPKSLLRKLWTNVDEPDFSKATSNHDGRVGEVKINAEEVTGAVTVSPAEAVISSNREEKK